MTKRDLIKWLEIKGKDAEIQAEKTRTNRIDIAKEEAYKTIGLDGFLNDTFPLMEQFLDKYKEYVEKHAKGDIRISKYGWHWGYNDMLTKFGDKARFRNELTHIIAIETEQFKKEVADANEYKFKVERSYNTVIETVKNLPTAKDGLEYLKKLGFDISEIEPAEKKKQLPATISVNVDTRYLLLDKESEDDRTEESNTEH